MPIRCCVAIWEGVNLLKVEVGPLLQPRYGTQLYGFRKVQFLGLPSVEDRLDNVGCQQGEAEDTADVGRVDRLGGGEVVDGGVDAGLQQLAPAESSGPRLDDGVVDTRTWRPRR